MARLLLYYQPTKLLVVHMSDGDMTVQEAGRRGGKKTLERHGLEHYHEIGVKGGASVRDKHGPEFYTEIAKRAARRTPRSMALRSTATLA